MTYNELSYKYLSRLADKIRERMPESSGDAANSLEVRGNQLLGNDYIYFLDQGRGPGKFPPPQNIVEWVRRKLGLEGNEAKGVAFIIGRKIANEGTEIYKNKRLGIGLDELVKEILEDLTKEAAEVAAVEVLTWL